MESKLVVGSRFPDTFNNGNSVRGDVASKKGVKNNVDIRIPFRICVK